MINGSTAFNTAVTEGGHPYTARISENGTVISCDVISCTIVKGSTGNEAFSVGGCFVPYIQMEVRELNTVLENKELKLEVGVYTDDTNIAWIDIGYFKVTKVESSTVKTTFTGVGRIAAVLSLIQPTLTSPITIASVISAVQAAVRAYDTKYSSFTINTSTVDTTGGEITESLDNLNARQLLEIVAGCVGGYLTEDNAGNVVIFKYNTSSTISYNGDRMIQHPTFSNYNYTLSNIKVIQQAEYELDDGTVVPEVSYIYDNTQSVDWIVSNKYMASQSMFNKFCTNCIGLIYRPATTELAYGDPRLEAIDVLKIIDTENVEYIVPGFSITHTITGGLRTTIVAPGMSEAEVDAEYKGPLTQQLDIMSSSVQTARAAAAQALSDADTAARAAASAVSDASDALTAATNAATSAGNALTAANNAQASADAASQSATDAYNQAVAATDSASVAQYSLSEIERVVDAINWIAEHGTYTLTADTEPLSGKWYFELVNGSYVQVAVNESDDPHALGYYELSSVDSSISNYVASHVSLDGNGLVIQTDNVNSKVRISASGVQLTNEQGVVVATFADSIVLGNANGMHVTLSPGDSSVTPVVLPELGFWQGSTKVAYINSDTLFINQANIVNTLRIGNFVWKVQGSNRVSLVYAP